MPNSPPRTKKRPSSLKVASDTSFEAGVKGRFLDGRAYVSLAAYHLDIKNYQDSFYNSTARAFQVRSLDAQSTGLEFEGQFKLNSALTAYGNLAWNPTAKLDNGERMQRAPRFTSTLGMRFNAPLSDSLTLSGGAPSCALQSCQICRVRCPAAP